MSLYKLTEDKSCVLFLMEYTSKSKGATSPSRLTRSVSFHVNGWTHPLDPSSDIINEITGFISWEIKIFSFLISQSYIYYPKVCVLYDLYLQVKGTNSEEKSKGKKNKNVCCLGALITLHAISWYYLILLISGLCHSLPVLSETHTVSPCILITSQPFKVAPGITDAEKTRSNKAQKVALDTRIFGQRPQPSAVSRALIKAVPTHRSSPCLRWPQSCGQRQPVINKQKRTISKHKQTRKLQTVSQAEKETN